MSLEIALDLGRWTIKWHACIPYHVNSMIALHSCSLYTEDKYLYGKVLSSRKSIGINSRILVQVVRVMMFQSHGYPVRNTNTETSICAYSYFLLAVQLCVVELLAL